MFENPERWFRALSLASLTGSNIYSSHNLLPPSRTHPLQRLSSQHRLSPNFGRPTPSSLRSGRSGQVEASRPISLPPTCSRPADGLPFTYRPADSTGCYRPSLPSQPVLIPGSRDHSNRSSPVLKNEVYCD